MTFITSAVPSSVRRLSMTASSAFRRLAYARAFGAARVGRHHRQVRVVHPGQIIDDDRRREQMVDRDVKEP
jgi:hypothetical protein